jgi:hypothetical protein
MLGGGGLSTSRVLVGDLFAIVPDLLTALGPKPER